MTCPTVIPKWCSSSMVGFRKLCSMPLSTNLSVEALYYWHFFKFPKEKQGKKKCPRVSALSNENRGKKKSEKHSILGITSASHICKQRCNMPHIKREAAVPRLRNWKKSLSWVAPRVGKNGLEVDEIFIYKKWHLLKQIKKWHEMATVGSSIIFSVDFLKPGCVRRNPCLISAARQSKKPEWNLRSANRFSDKLRFI